MSVLKRQNRRDRPRLKRAADTEAQRSWLAWRPVLSTATPISTPRYFGIRWHLVLFHGGGNVGGAWQLRFELGAAKAENRDAVIKRGVRVDGDQPEGARRRRGSGGNGFQRLSILKSSGAASVSMPPRNGHIRGDVCAINVIGRKGPWNGRATGGRKEALR